MIRRFGPGDSRTDRRKILRRTCRNGGRRSCTGGAGGGGEAVGGAGKGGAGRGEAGGGGKEEQEW